MHKGPQLRRPPPGSGPETDRYTSAAEPSAGAQETDGLWTGTLQNLKSKIDALPGVDCPCEPVDLSQASLLYLQNNFTFNAPTRTTREPCQLTGS